MIIGLAISLTSILLLPFFIKKVEHNLEVFLFIMGLITTIITGVISTDLLVHILHNEMLYFITLAVLIAGIIFKFTVDDIANGVEKAAQRIHLSVFLFFIICVLGIISSIITAIIASLILAEVAKALPIERKYKVRFCIITCFSIGLGAALTPIGEPLSTIVISLLKEDFFFLAKTIGIYILPGIIVLGLIGAVNIGANAKIIYKSQMKREAREYNCPISAETYPVILIRALKIFLFVVALELLGAGFRPMMDLYILHLDSVALYWINMGSAVLDNATIAAAEISPKMESEQIKAILMGLLISGGMLIPGNIPNIITACKLNIGSKDWAKFGVPLGLAFLIIYFIVLFLIQPVGSFVNGISI